MLTFLVEDDGVGFDPATTPAGTGLSNLRDRIESAGGTLMTETTPGGGTRIRAALPARPVPAPAVMTGPSQLGPSQLGPLRRGADVRARIAWVLTAVTLVLVVADVVVTAQYRSLLSEDASCGPRLPLRRPGRASAVPLLGAFILAQDDRHPIGLILLLVGFTSAVSLVTEAYSVWVTSEAGPGSAEPGQRGRVAVRAARRAAGDRRARADVPARAGRATAVASVGGTPQRSPVLGALLCTGHSSPRTPTTYDITAAVERFRARGGVDVLARASC